MAKIKVKLHCQWDDGESVQQPGTLLDMERDEAMPLMSMGMVEVIKEKAETKPVQPSTATKPAAKAKAAAKKPKPAKDKNASADGPSTEPEPTEPEYPDLGEDNNEFEASDDESGDSDNAEGLTDDA